MKPFSKLVCENGFTLVEIAIVLLIVTLLVTGLVPTISSQVEQRQVNDTRRQLDEIQQALIGFAVIYGRLPCPAAPTGNGEEGFAAGGDASNGDCSNFLDGFVPAATLGIASVEDNQGRKGYAVDAWGNRIRYAVTNWDKTAAPAVSKVYTKSDGMAVAGISALAPNLLVCAGASASGFDGSSCGTDNALTAGNGVPAVLFSTGKNGAYGGGGLDEAANLDGNRTFVSHPPAAGAALGGEFDDLVVWISNQILISRMIAAGRLP